MLSRVGIIMFMLGKVYFIILLINILRVLSVLFVLSILVFVLDTYRSTIFLLLRESTKIYKLIVSTYTRVALHDKFKVTFSKCTVSI